MHRSGRWEVRDLEHQDEGGEFIGMSEALATHLVVKNNQILPKAQKTFPIPDVIPKPEIQVVGLDDLNELFGKPSKG